MYNQENITLVTIIDQPEFKITELKPGIQGVLISSGINIYNGKYTIQVVWETGESSSLTKNIDSWTEESITKKELNNVNPRLASICRESNI